MAAFAVMSTCTEPFECDDQTEFSLNAVSILDYLVFQTVMKLLLVFQSWDHINSFS